MTIFIIIVMKCCRSFQNKPDPCFNVADIVFSCTQKKVARNFKTSRLPVLPVEVQIISWSWHFWWPVCVLSVQLEPFGWWVAIPLPWVPPNRKAVYVVHSAHTAELLWVNETGRKEGSLAGITWLQCKHWATTSLNLLLTTVSFSFLFTCFDKKNVNTPKIPWGQRCLILPTVWVCVSPFLAFIAYRTCCFS